MLFIKGKLFIIHITTRQVKHIGSWVKNLYALELCDGCKALRSKENVRDLVVEREVASGSFGVATTREVGRRLGGGIR